MRLVQQVAEAFAQGGEISSHVVLGIEPGRGEMYTVMPWAVIICLARNMW
jgi:hypothetical protein